MYIGGLDLSTVDLAAIGGPPPPHKFVVYAWNYDVVQVVLAADRLSGTKYGKLQPMAKHAIDYSVFGRPENFGKWMDVHSAPSCSVEARAPVEHLVGQFSPSMTKLLEKLVEGWTTLTGSDSDGVARQFTSFVGERTHHPTGCPGQYDYGSSQELPDTQEDLFGDGFGGVDAGLYMDGDDDMENVQHDTDHDESREVRVGAIISMVTTYQDPSMFILILAGWLTRSWNDPSVCSQVPVYPQLAKYGNCSGPAMASAVDLRWQLQLSRHDNYIVTSNASVVEDT
ncbi:hypothetical protein D1007_15500 [Hordeum vulgare]|nr:hypothetical protein D1007_15500 [Hordeum vulgare]